MRRTCRYLFLKVRLLRNSIRFNGLLFPFVVWNFVCLYVKCINGRYVVRSGNVGFLFPYVQSNHVVYGQVGPHQGEANTLREQRVLRNFRRSVLNRFFNVFLIKSSANRRSRCLLTMYIRGVLMGDDLSPRSTLSSVSLIIFRFIY